MFFCKRVMLNILTIFLVNLYKNKLFRDLKYLAESWNLYLYSNSRRRRFSESVVFKISPWNSQKRLMNNFLYKETEKSNFFFLESSFYAFIIYDMQDLDIVMVAESYKSLDIFFNGRYLQIYVKVIIIPRFVYNTSKHF